MRIIIKKTQKPFPKLSEKRAERFHLIYATLAILAMKPVLLVTSFQNTLYTLYHKVRNQYSALLKSARVNYYSNLIDQCAGDSRKLFRVVNSLSREPLETALPEHDDPTKLANEFGTFFLKKIEIIKENLDKFQVQEPRLAPVSPKENLENFSALSIGEVCKIVRESSNAFCRLDPVPTWLVKSCLDVLALPITEMVNLSFLSGCVPEN